MEKQFGEKGSLGEDLEAEWKSFLRPPKRRKITTRVMAKGMVEGFATLLFMLGGDDRTKLLLQILRRMFACSPNCNVEDIHVKTMDSFGKIFIQIVFRIVPQAKMTRSEFLAYAKRETEKLERELSTFDGEAIHGERFLPARILKMSALTPHRPGELLDQLEKIAAIDGSISELSLRSFKDRAMLSYTIGLPSDDDEEVERLKRQIEATPSGTRVAYDADAAVLETSFPRAFCSY